MTAATPLRFADMVGNHHCKWPVGPSPASAEMDCSVQLFCCEHRVAGRPYCQVHETASRRKSR